jgi:acyl carrier protein
VNGWDSLKHWEIIAAIETCFGIEFSMDEAVAFKDLSDIDACLKSKGFV